MHRKAWTQELEIAAVAVERADMWAQLHAAALGVQGKDLPPAVTFSHPERAEPEKPNVKRTSDPAEIRAFLGQR